MPVDRSRTRAAVVERQAGAEIHEDDASAVFAHDVLGLDVAVQQAGGVDGREGLAEVLPDESGFACAAGTFVDENLRQGPAANELHAQPGPAVPLLGVVHDDHVRVLHARQRPRFVQHAVHHAGARQARMQKLDRDLTLQLQIARPVDVPERSFPHQLEELDTPPAGNVLTEVLGYRRCFILALASRLGKRQNARDRPGLRTKRRVVDDARLGSLHVGDLRQEPDVAKELADRARRGARWSSSPNRRRRSLRPPSRPRARARLVLAS